MWLSVSYCNSNLYFTHLFHSVYVSFDRSFVLAAVFWKEFFSLFQMIKKRGRARENGKDAAPKISKFAALLYRYARTQTAQKDTFLKLKNSARFRFDSKRKRRCDNCLPWYPSASLLSVIGYHLKAASRQEDSNLDFYKLFCFQVSYYRYVQQIRKRCCRSPPRAFKFSTNLSFSRLMISDIFHFYFELKSCCFTGYKVWYDARLFISTIAIVF